MRTMHLLTEILKAGVMTLANDDNDDSNSDERATRPRADGGDVPTYLQRKYPDKLLHDCPEFPDVDGVALEPGATCEACGHEADEAMPLGSWAAAAGPHHKIIAVTDESLEWSACGRTIESERVDHRRLFSMPSISEMCGRCATVLAEERREEVEP